MLSANWPARPSFVRDLRKLLGGVQDLERLLAKITLGSANPRDLFALGTISCTTSRHYAL